jgi:hypothetical protein
VQAAKAEVEQRTPIVEAPQAPSTGELAIAANQSREHPNQQSSCCTASTGRSGGSRRGWLIAGALAVPLALYAGWDWLAATGLATILVAAAPCLVMCALGLCMRHGAAKSAPSVADIRKTYEAESPPPPKHG